MADLKMVQKMKVKRCPSSYLGVRCHRRKGHSGNCKGLERGRSEVWQWSDDPDDVLVTAPWDGNQIRPS